ncbi:MAG: hypothetical protein ACXWDJ_11835, partial [Aeromicrobium sp.]
RIPDVQLDLARELFGHVVPLLGGSRVLFRRGPSAISTLMILARRGAPGPPPWWMNHALLRA